MSKLHALHTAHLSLRFSYGIGQFYYPSSKKLWQKELAVSEIPEKKTPEKNPGKNAPGKILRE